MERTIVSSHRRTAILVAVVAFVVLLASLGGFGSASAASSSPSPAAAGATVLRIGWLETPDNLNPFIGIQGTDYELWHLNYDFLVGFDSKTLAPRPELATSWSVAPDQKTWTFKIRSGVKWQDGVPLTAKDVAFTFNYIVDNNLTNLSIYTDGIKHATATDDTTCVIVTKAPKANILQMVVPIIPEHIWSKVPGKLAGTSYVNKPPIIGSGPYQIVEFQQGKFVRLQANKDYWGGAPKIDELIFQTYQNANNMVDELKNDTIQGAVNVPMAQFASLASAAGITTNKGTSWQFTELGFNCYDSPDSLGNPVLLDPKFRQALSWAVDRQKVLDVAFQGYGTLGSTLIVPYSPYHWQPPADQTYGYDPAKANSLLDAAGYKMGPNGVRLDKNGKPISLRLYVTTDAPENQAAARFVVGWFKDVGIQVKLTVMDPGALIDAQYNYKGNTFAPDYDMFMWYWTEDVDPQFMLGIYTPGQIEGWNDVCWTDPAYSKLQAQQSTTIDEAQRIPLAQQQQQLFYEAAPYIIFTYPYQLEAYNTKSWTGWVHAPSDYPGVSGSVLYDYNNVDTYKQVAPVTASATTGSGSSSTGLIVGIVIVVIVVVVVVVLLLRRRGTPRSLEE
jgi:peptide/nickel transport system substrate-binding protein